MKKSILMMVAFVCATCLMISCKKDYQKLATEFIRNLPDSCELLVQVENEAEHLVYFKGQGTDAFFCYNAETEKTETISVPNMDGASAYNIGAGKENILIGYKENVNDSVNAHAYVQLYNLKTQGFKKFTTCNWYKFDEGTKQISCFSYKTNKYGDGTCTIDIYDSDGNLLTKKDIEVSQYKEVPAGTLAAKHQAVSQSTNVGAGFSKSPRYYCELCGEDFPSVQYLTMNTCFKNNGGKHKLYEGSEKSEYTCKYCGLRTYSIKSLVMNRCHKNPVGDRHAPAL